jgi:hypothetical protein
VAETAPRKRAPRKTAPPKPELQLVTEPCPLGCEHGEVPKFDPTTGLWGRDVCGRCLGVGEIERQHG